ncbi:5-methylcytosine-specific restriction endonuclease McrA [Salinibacterium sp. CAN_S4]
MSPETSVFLIAAAAVASLALIWLLLIVRERKRISEASEALRRLEDLNASARASLDQRPPISQSFTMRATSKQRFDRQDLPAVMASNVLDNEEWFVQEVELRVAATICFSIYDRDFESLGDRFLGNSGHPSVKEARFTSIEMKQFRRRKLKYPVPMARVSSVVKYTSPKGQNSYSRSLSWDFDQLTHGLQLPQATRARQSTTQALRRRERSLMTDHLRMTILRGDSYRCRMCGASASNGATLHVDHIIPVSRDGRTVPENLQTLCEPCNLGKSNRFVG